MFCSSMSLRVLDECKYWKWVLQKWGKNLHVPPFNLNWAIEPWHVNTNLEMLFFEMVAMPFPCNGLCFVVFNLPTVLLMFSIIWLVVLSLISIFFVFIADGLAFALSSFKMFLFLCHNSSLLAFFIIQIYTLEPCHFLQWYHCLFFWPS